MKIKLFAFLLTVFFINSELFSALKDKKKSEKETTFKDQASPIKKQDIAITIRDAARKKRFYKKEARRRERQELLFLLVSMLSFCVLADSVPLEKYDPMFLS